MTVQAHPAARPGLARTGRAGSGLAGTGALAKLAFRRDRIMLPAWVYLITVLVATTAYSLKKLYPTAAARAQLVVDRRRQPRAPVPVRAPERVLDRRAHRLAVRRLGGHLRRADDDLHRDQAYPG